MFNQLLNLLIFICTFFTATVVGNEINPKEHEEIQKSSSEGRAILITSSVADSVGCERPSAAPRSSDDEDSKTFTHPFFLISIPKSGTHLCAKLLLLLTNKRHKLMYDVLKYKNFEYFQFEREILQCQKNNCFFCAHPFPDYFDPHLLQFSDEYPEYIPVLAIRDLRDVMISFMFHKQLADNLDQEMGRAASFDEKLTHLLSLTNSNQARTIESAIRSAIENWISHPNTIILRFEDLVGSQGKGGDLKQKEVILDLASQLGIQPSEEQLQYIYDNLFGNETFPKVSATFKKGEIGNWRHYFNASHRELFEQNWGAYQIVLGYSLDDWGS